jgi:hypothetical protein
MTWCVHPGFLALSPFLSFVNSHPVRIQTVPIISITFYMVIIRITIANSNSQGNTAHSLGLSNAMNGLSARSRGGGREDDDEPRYPLKRMEVHITRFTENQTDSDKGGKRGVDPEGESRSFGSDIEYGV